MDEFESSAGCMVHISVCGFGAVLQVGESTCNALLAFVTSVLYVAGVPHLVPCCLWLPLSGFPGGMPGARQPPVQILRFVLSGAPGKLVATAGACLSPGFPYLLVIKLSCFSIVCLDH